MQVKSHLISLCSALSRSHPELVFWKHLDRALNGHGDIDTFLVDESQIDEVSKHFAMLALQTIPTARAVITCTHLPNARLHLVVAEDSYPNLLEFDIGIEITRMGSPWFSDRRKLRSYVIQTGDGISVLRPGALSVVLLALYGIHHDGRLTLKAHDYDSVVNGIRFDKATSINFAEDVLPPHVVQKFQRLINEIDCSGWSASAAKEVWRQVFFHSFVSMRRRGLIGTARQVIHRCLPACSVRQTIFSDGRVGRATTWQEFLDNNSKSHSIVRA